MNKAPNKICDTLKAIYENFIFLSRLKIGWDLCILYLYRGLEHGGKEAKRERIRVKVNS